MLVVYLGVIAYLNRDTLTVEKDYFRYFGSIAAELVIIVALSYFLRKKFLLKKQRENRV